MGIIRDLDSTGIEELLRTSLVGRIACCSHGADGDGRPYVVPLAYGYDGEAIYAHSGPGKKIRMMRAEPRVTFEVDSVQASDRWQSVIAEGTYEELDEPFARDHALSVIYGPREAVPSFDAATVVYRIRLTARTGKFERPD